MNTSICFVCNEQRKSDGNIYCEGGLGKFQEGRSEERLISRTNTYLQDPTQPFYQAACRFTREVDWIDNNTNVANIYFHQSCYIRYANYYTVEPG